ncbi:MAG: hypothetical protein GQ565_07905 [Candidatus Aegiribacteria sp.]|nr:hypothetical protein [Candidatus Aegiribacteria sp.]
MKKYRTGLVTLICALLISLVAVSCNSPAEPSTNPTPAGKVIAWFNGLGYTIDLYFPESDSLVTGAYTTGEIPSDIISHEKGRIAVLNSTSSNIQVFDVNSTGGELFHIDLPAGSNPYQMSWDGNHLWVTLLLTAQVAKVDLIPGGSVSIIDIKANPTSIASSGSRVLVGHGSSYPNPSVTGGITVLDASTGNVVDSIDTPENVNFMRYFSKTGLVHAMTSTYNANNGLISIVDPINMQILSQVNTGGSPGFPVETGSGYTVGDGWSSGSIYFYDGAGVLADTWDTGAASTCGLACIGDTLYIADYKSDMVYISDWTSKVILDSLSAGDGPQGIIAVER